MNKWIKENIDIYTIILIGIILFMVILVLISNPYNTTG